jgi:hypothetical protein
MRPHQRRRSRMIHHTIKVLTIIGVLFHLLGYGDASVAAAEQTKEANQSSNRNHSLSEQFVRSLSVTKGSSRRASPQTKQTQTMEGLSRRMQKHRTIQRRKGGFREPQKKNRHPSAMHGGSRGARNEIRKPTGSRREKNRKWQPGGWSGGRDRYGGNSDKWKSPPNPGWGSSWGQGWGGSVNKPGSKPTKRK